MLTVLDIAALVVWMLFLCVCEMSVINVFIDNEETVHSRLKTLAEELMQTQQMLLNKEEAVLELEKRIEESSKTYEKKSEWVKQN